MTDTALDTLPDTHADRSLADRARDAAGAAQEKVTTAASATLGAAKDHPYAAAGIAAGVAAAVGGAALAATKLGGKTAPAKKPTAKRATAKK